MLTRRNRHDVGWKADKRLVSILTVLEDLKAFADRSHYRIGSAALVAIICVTVASVNIGIPAWLIFIVVVASKIVLTIITYHRLRDADLSTAWLLLMILQFGIGPTWHLSDHVSFNIGGSIISLVPVMLGWIVPRMSDQKNEAETV
jgi:uncharacterized membrane protein YhaH (DUF805 family)